MSGRSIEIRTWLRTSSNGSQTDKAKECASLAKPYLWKFSAVSLRMENGDQGKLWLVGKVKDKKFCVNQSEYNRRSEGAPTDGR